VGRRNKLLKQVYLDKYMYRRNTDPEKLIQATVLYTLSFE